MGDGKALVVYYSRTGTTKQVAEAIAGGLRAELEEIVDTKSRKGMLGFVAGGKDACLSKLTVIEEARSDPSAYDLVVIGTPVWASSVTPAIRTYMMRCKDALPGVAFFLTTGGTGIDRTFKQMAELCGKEPIARLALTTKEVRKGQAADKVEAFVKELGG